MKLALILPVLSLLALTPLASADSLVAAAPGARHLEADHGYAVWFAPAPGNRWRLTVRDRDGKVTQPAGVRPLGAPTDPAIGYSGPGLAVLYSRCLGASTTRGCDVYRYDLRRGGRERPVPIMSSRRYSETNPGVSGANFGFVRRGGPRPGTYSYKPDSTGLRRLSRRPADHVAVSMRILYTFGRTAVLRPLSGGRARTYRLPAAPRDVFLTRYRFGFLAAGGRVFQTDRFASSGTQHEVQPAQAGRRLPASTASIGLHGEQVQLFLDAEGVKAVDPELF